MKQDDTARRQSHPVVRQPSDAATSDVTQAAPQDDPSDVHDLRGQVVREIDQMSQQIEQLISVLNDKPGEPQTAIDALSEQLALLQAARETAQSGHQQQLAALGSQLPALQANVQAVRAQAGSDAAVQASNYTAEITSVIRERSATQMADRLAARDFAAMTEEQLTLIDRRVENHIAQSDVAETRAHGGIETLAEVRGIDLSAYRFARARLQVDEDDARRRGDLVELARVSLLQSTNSFYGTQEVGGDAELLAERRQQIEADEAALRLALRSRAAREAKVQGKSSQAAADHIDAFEQREIQAVRAEQATLAEGRNVPDQVGHDTQAAEKLYLERSREEAEEATLPMANMTQERGPTEAGGLGEMTAISGAKSAEEAEGPMATPTVATTGTDRNRS